MSYSDAKRWRSAGTPLMIKVTQSKFRSMATHVVLTARCPVTELMGWARSADRWSFDYHSIRHVYFERTMHAHAVEQCADCSRGCTEID